MMSGKRLMKAVVAVALVLTGLVGCSQAPMAPAEPQNAQELLKRWEEDPNNKNYHMDMSIDVTASFLGQTFKMPMKMVFDIAEENTHGTMEMDLSAMGTPKMESEIYIEKEGDKLYQYSSVENDGKKTWTKTSQESTDIARQFTSADLLGDAEFSKTEDGGYQLTIPAKKLLETLNSADSLESVMGGLDEQAVKDALEDAKAVYTFDKDCRPQNVSLDIDITIDPTKSGSDSDTSADTDSNVQLDLTGKMQMALNLALSNFGGVDAASIAVPEDVKKSAVDMSDDADDASSTDAASSDAAAEQKEAA